MHRLRKQTGWLLIVVLVNRRVHRDLRRHIRHTDLMIADGELIVVRGRRRRGGKDIEQGQVGSVGRDDGGLDQYLVRALER